MSLTQENCVVYFIVVKKGRTAREVCAMPAKVVRRGLTNYSEDKMQERYFLQPNNNRFFTKKKKIF